MCECKNPICDGVWKFFNARSASFERDSSILVILSEVPSMPDMGFHRTDLPDYISCPK